MALSARLHLRPISIPALQYHHRAPLSSTLPKRNLLLYPSLKSNPGRPPKMVIQAGSVQSAFSEAMKLIQSSPPTWRSALLSNILIFLLGTPILVSGLSPSGIGAAFLLGTLTWRAFGLPGFLLVATYFVIVSHKQNRKKELFLLTLCVPMGGVCFLDISLESYMVFGLFFDGFWILIVKSI